MQASTSGMSSPLVSEEKPVMAEVMAASMDQLSKEGDDSDADVRKVPEMVGRASTSGGGGGSFEKHRQGGRKRSALPAEKEHKRMKRLLRNRVSAQQARERKKAYLSDLEMRTKELEQRNAELEEKVSTLQQENAMLRKIIKSTAIRTSPSGDK